LNFYAQFDVLVTRLAAAKLDTQVLKFIWLPSEDPGQPVAGMHSFDTLAA
jgi:fatty-acyl-CoA synthase